MPSPRDIRRLAFQTLFQIDARGERDAEEILATLAGAGEFSESDRRKAFELARSAYAGRARADAAMEALAPTWPASRQAAVDRAILRLAYHELTTGSAPGAVIVNEAVELAKEFSTEKSPPFVNALLDKVLKLAEGKTA